MLTAVVSALLCGSRGCEGIVEWVHDLPLDFCHWMGFTRWPPKKDAFRDLLMKLDPAVLERAIQQWMFGEDGQNESPDILKGISIDGKCLCGTLRAHSKAVHLLAAVDHHTGGVLSQIRVEEKTNEYNGSLVLLKNLLLKNRVVVGDAMFCQRDVCEEVLVAGGDSLFSVKENQPNLLRDIELEFTAAPAARSFVSRRQPPHANQQRAAEQQTASTLDKGHGRLEKRTITTTISLNNHLNWPGVNQVCRVVRERTLQGKHEIKTAYFITSLPRHKADASRLLSLIRGPGISEHWGAIENGLHHVRDTTFDEDHCAIYRSHAPDNLATLRNTAIHWLRLIGSSNLSQTMRSFTRQPLRLFSILGYFK